MSHIAERRRKSGTAAAPRSSTRPSRSTRVGWDAVTMDQVARRARLSRALVYVYFRDKPDLHSRWSSARSTRCAGASRRPATASSAASTKSRRSAGRTSPSRASCPTTSTPARVSRRAPAATASSRTRRLHGAGHRVHETIVASLNRGVADGSIRATSATRTSRHSHSGRSRTASCRSRHQVRPDGDSGIAVQRFFDHAIAMELRTLLP